MTSLWMVRVGSWQRVGEEVLVIPTSRLQPIARHAITKAEVKVKNWSCSWSSNCSPT